MAKVLRAIIDARMNTCQEKSVAIIIFLSIKMMCKDGECSSINIVVICSASCNCSKSVIPLMIDENLYS